MSEEKLLALPGGRTLAYAEAGSVSSVTVVIFFHGAFGVGDVNRLSPVLLQKDVHYIAPTLPGWGNSSPARRGVTYAASLVADISTLIDHLHPNIADVKLYIAGVSFGTVAAQMVYGASYEVFPTGRNIVSLLLINPFSPFNSHRGYSKCMSWGVYLAFGYPARLIPFHLIPRLMKLTLKNKVSTPEAAESFLQITTFGKMDDAELSTLEQWRVSQGLEKGQVEREMAQNFVLSVAKSWDGFLGMAGVLHSDWGGFTPSGLDDEHSRRPVLIVSGKGDYMTPEGWALYLAENYKNAQMKSFEGGHLAALFHLDEIWEEFFEL